METGWVEVRNCNWLHEAILLKSVLGAADIDARIPDEHTLSANPALGAGLGGVRLLVRSSDLARARDVLEAAGESGRAGSTHHRSLHDHS